MIIFDLDGTLIDSNSIWIDVDIQFLSRRGKEITPEYTEFVTHAIFPTAARFTKDYYQLDDSLEEIQAEWMELARAAYQFHAPCKPGVLEYMELCQKRGDQMALFTASVPELGRMAVERLGFDRYLSELIFAHDLGLDKHNPEAFRMAVQKLGVSPGECTMFEDSARNCAAAKVAGLTVVGVYDRFYADRQAQVKESSHRYIMSFEELL